MRCACASIAATGSSRVAQAVEPRGARHELRDAQRARRTSAHPRVEPGLLLELRGEQRGADAPARRRAAQRRREARRDERRDGAARAAGRRAEPDGRAAG